MNFNYYDFILNLDVKEEFEFLFLPTLTSLFGLYFLKS